MITKATAKATLKLVFKDKTIIVSEKTIKIPKVSNKNPWSKGSRKKLSFDTKSIDNVYLKYLPEYVVFEIDLYAEDPINNIYNRNIKEEIITKEWKEFNHLGKEYSLSNYRFPNTKDLEKGDWKRFLETTPNPYYKQGYFDNNNLLDEAWILISKDNNTTGIAAIMNEKDTLLIEHMDFSPFYIQLYKLEKGTYPTACGKGYWDCRAGEKPKINVKRNAFGYSPYESGGACAFLFNRKESKFKKYTMND